MAIDSDKTGNAKILELLETIEATDWNDFEYDFILSLKDKRYESLSSKQQSFVGRLYDKYLGL